MRDLVDPFWMKAKAALFLLLGLGAAAFIIEETQSWSIAICLAIAVWSFCRLYYFAFYVIEHYVDPGFKFSGLWSFACHVFARRTAASDKKK